MEQAKNIERLLGQTLDPKHIKGRTQGGVNVSYIEGWHAIAEANRIFGFLNWQRETAYCKEVSREKNQNNNHIVGYEAKVRITVFVDGRAIMREGTGAGSGISKSLFDAIEGASKEAETDAMKRAFMTFGNPFGLALYDKSRANVGEVDDRTPEQKQAEDRAKKEAWVNAMIRKLYGLKTIAEIDAEIAKAAGNLDVLKSVYPDLRAEFDATIHAMRQTIAGYTDEPTTDAAILNGDSHA